MDNYEENRRNFLRKLGLTVRATLTASSMLSANIIESQHDMNISPEQMTFMETYNNWMDEFIEVIKIQKVDPENYENNKDIVKLSEQAKAWQSKLIEFMKDDNFARYYMKVTERMTLEI
jgi:3-dehydroquinate dehydratase